MSKTAEAPEPARTEAYPEAAAILRDAGWAPHNTWLVYTQGSLVMGFDHMGSFHVKDWMRVPPGHAQHGPDTPDTAEEAARWLVAAFPKPIEIVRPGINVTPHEAVPTYAEEDMARPANDAGGEVQPINIQVNPVFNVTGGHATNDASAGAENEAHGEAGETDSSNGSAASDAANAPDVQETPRQSSQTVSELGAPKTFAIPSTEYVGKPDVTGESAAEQFTALESVDEAPIPESPPADRTEAPPQDSLDSGHGGAEAGEAEGLDDAAGGTAIQRGQVHDEPGLEGAGGGDDDYALDADFAEIGDEREELAALEFGAEVEDDFLPPPKTDDFQQAQDRYIGLSDFDRKKIVRLDTIRRTALRLRMEALGDWSETELQNQQAQLNRFVRGELGAGPLAQAHFDAVADRLSALSRIDGVRSRKEIEIETATEQTIDAIDPEFGWP